jgi:superfamily II DNA or RNA helicase
MKAAVQAKRTFVFSASDTECVQTLLGALGDFRNSAQFDQRRGRGLWCRPASKKKYATVIFICSGPAKSLSDQPDGQRHHRIVLQSDAPTDLAVGRHRFHLGRPAPSPNTARSPGWPARTSLKGRFWSEKNTVSREFEKTILFSNRLHDCYK